MTRGSTGRARGGWRTSDLPFPRRLPATGASRCPRVEFIYTWDLEWCPIFCNLKTLLLNEWFTAIDLVCILQHSPVLEMLTLQLGGIKNLTRARGAQKPIEQSFMCAHLKIVNIECDEVDEDIRKILKILWACGILRGRISIKAPSSPSYFFSFQKDPLPLLPL